MLTGKELYRSKDNKPVVKANITTTYQTKLASTMPKRLFSFSLLAPFGRRGVNYMATDNLFLEGDYSPIFRHKWR